MTEPAKGWGLRYTSNSGQHFIILKVFRTRREAIACYDGIFTKPNAYRRDRRKGEAMAVRVELREVTE